MIESPNTYIYLIGTGHCGSTLLSLILGSHSRVVSVGEVRVLGRYVKKNESCTCNAPILNCSFWQGVLKDFHFSKSADESWETTNLEVFEAYKSKSLAARLSRKILLLALRTQSQPLLSGQRFTSRRYKQFLKAIDDTFLVLDSACRTSGKGFVVDTSKSPARMKSLYVARPQNSRVIYLVRDGRAYIESMRREKGYTAEVAVAEWIRVNQSAMQMLEGIPQSQQLKIRYEEFCDDPIKGTREICEWLGLDFESDILNFRASKHHDVRGNIMRFSSASEIRKDEVWRQRLSEHELSTFCEIAGTFAQRIGYRLLVTMCFLNPFFELD